MNWTNVFPNLEDALLFSVYADSNTMERLKKHVQERNFCHVKNIIYHVLKPHIKMHMDVMATVK